MEWKTKEYKAMSPGIAMRSDTYATSCARTRMSCSNWANVGANIGAA